MKELRINKTIGQFVADNFKAAEVFNKYNIDFCCGGKRELVDVCTEKGISYATISKELEDLEDRIGCMATQNFKLWDAAFLSDYIVQNHHNYVSDSIPILLELTVKIARVHGKSHPELIEIAYTFKALADELTSHMKKEEIVLFPFIKQLINAQKSGFDAPISQFNSVQNPIHCMEEEHEEAGVLIHKIKALSNDFTPPEDACTSYKVAFAKLKEFEQDLYQHIHLENNILFPKAIELEGAFSLA